MSEMPEIPERFEVQILINALKAIIHHQELMGGGLSELSTTKFIAEKALLEYRLQVEEGGKVC